MTEQRKSDRAGREVPREYRDLVNDLVDNQGWRYDNQRRGHPMVFPADKSAKAIPVPGTPGDNRSFKNWVAQVRRAGGKI